MEHELQDLLFNPLWAKDPVYDVVCDSPSRERRGRMPQEGLDQLLADRGVDEGKDRRRLTALMLACELCFKISGGKPQSPDYLIVDQVPAAGKGAGIQFPKLENEREKRLEWHFDFLPDYLLAQWLGRWFAQHDPKGTYYRDEVVFADKVCRVRIRAYPAEHRLQLTFRFKRVEDWKRMHDSMEREVRSMFDPEGLRPETPFWRVVDPDKETSSVLTDKEKRLIVTLLRALPQIAGVSINDTMEERLQEALKCELQRSLDLKRDSERLAWRAYHIVFLEKSLHTHHSPECVFPMGKHINEAREVGVWFSRNPPIKQALEAANRGRKLATLEAGDGESPFRALQKAYVKAIEFLQRQSADLGNSEQ